MAAAERMRNPRINPSLYSVINHDQFAALNHDDSLVLMEGSQHEGMDDGRLGSASSKNSLIYAPTEQPNRREHEKSLLALRQ